MAYFQNVFVDDFISAIGPMGDRQYNANYKCPPNTGRGRDIVVTWAAEPFNLSGNDTDGNSKANLTLMVAIDSPNFKEWGRVVVDIRTGASSASAVTAEEVISLLNADTNFSGWFTATLNEVKDSTNLTVRKSVLIRQRQQHERMRFYVVNGGAEEVVRFNARAGVAELPTWFDRHTIANRIAFVDSMGVLIKLDTVLNVDAAFINNAVDKNENSLGYSSSTVKADYQLLRGSSDNFMFTKNTLDGNTPPRITTTIQYPAGAVVGDMSKKTTYAYTSTNLNPDKITEVPYVLTSGDLVTP